MQNSLLNGNFKSISMTKRCKLCTLIGNSKSKLVLLHFRKFKIINFFNICEYVGANALKHCTVDVPQNIAIGDFIT